MAGGTPGHKVWARVPSRERWPSTESGCGAGGRVRAIHNGCYGANNFCMAGAPPPPSETQPGHGPGNPLATPSSALTLHVVLSAPIAPHWDLLPHTITAFYRCNPFLADLPPPPTKSGGEVGSWGEVTSSSAWALTRRPGGTHRYKVGVRVWRGGCTPTLLQGGGWTAPLPPA